MCMPVPTGSLLGVQGSYRRYDDPLTNNATWKVPLAMQALPAVLLSFGVFFCNESPRWLARQDNWEEATRILSHTRKLVLHHYLCTNEIILIACSLPPTHPYVQKELDDVREQIENEKRMMGGSTIWDLLREMWTIKGNRNRVLISMGLMALQQMTGAYGFPFRIPSHQVQANDFSAVPSTTMPQSYSRVLVFLYFTNLFSWVVSGV